MRIYLYKFMDSLAKQFYAIFRVVGYKFEFILNMIFCANHQIHFSFARNREINENIAHWQIRLH